MTPTTNYKGLSGGDQSAPSPLLKLMLFKDLAIAPFVQAISSQQLRILEKLQTRRQISEPQIEAMRLQTRMQTTMLPLIFELPMEIKLESEEKLIEYVETTSLLDKLWKTGRIHFNDTSYDHMRKIWLLDSEVILMIKIMILRTASGQLAGSISDMLSHERDSIPSEAFMQSAVAAATERRYAEFKGSCHPRLNLSMAAKKAEDNLKVAYGAANKDNGLVWCPITRNFVMHTFPENLIDIFMGEYVGPALFGHGPRSIDPDWVWDLDNSFIVHTDYRRLLDCGDMTIVPLTGNPQEKRLKIVLLNDAIRFLCSGLLTVHDLKNRELEFKTDARPNNTCLYFRFTTSVLLSRRRNPRTKDAGGFEELHQLPYSPTKSLWTSYKASSWEQFVLYRVSILLGCMNTARANEFWGIDASLWQAPENDTAITLSIWATLGVIACFTRAATVLNIFQHGH